MAEKAVVTRSVSSTGLGRGRPGEDERRGEEGRQPSEPLRRDRREPRAGVVRLELALRRVGRERARSARALDVGQHAVRRLTDAGHGDPVVGAQRLQQALMSFGAGGGSPRKRVPIVTAQTFALAFAEKADLSMAPAKQASPIA
jgi:hypothetical protein